MSINALIFFSIVEQDEIFEIDHKQLKKVRSQFEELTKEKDRKDPDVRTEMIDELIKHFQLIDDENTRICVTACVENESEEDAALDIDDRIRRNLPKTNQTVEPDFNAEIDLILRDPSPPTVPKMKNTDSTVALNRIICIIHQKSTKTEVTQFFSEFLFRLVPISTSRHVENHPIIDGQIHRLENGCILDLFIRQQIADRGSITVNDGVQRCRLVEPITRTDEFDAWRFDHFHNLMDFWLTIEPQCQTDLPKRWKLTDDAQIEYIVKTKITTGENNSRTEQNERPNTKSLRNFIDDICRIEGNQKSHEWYKILVEQESITEYSNLTNLNAREWERMTKLPMNALKTIKFYIDQEKQMAEERKLKKSNTLTGEQEKYSKAEIRANLHMIKLFINRQLEHHDDIEILPLVDSFCVHEAFEEMRKDGFEDDGLFPQMELFFQALTVADKDLLIDREKQSETESKEEQQLREELSKVKSECQQVQKLIDNENQKIDKLEEEKKELHKKFKQEKNELKDKKAECGKLELTWTTDNEKLVEKIEEKKKIREGYKQNLNEQEDIRKKIELRLKTIQDNMTKSKNVIDRRFVKPHRGFIMYGPPGTGKSAIMSQIAKKIGIAMIGPALAAGELERPYVGQSEAVILDLCLRANRLPHLMCCLSIDEVDSLAPKRSDDSSEGKVSKISVLLSVIEGIKDVPNLMFFSATNRLHMMDEAFLRRMSGKFFVGRPSAEARQNILNKISTTILQPYILENLGTATTNFSGAALKALSSAITVEYIAERRQNPNYRMKEDKALELTDRTAQQFQLYLGLDTLPRLLLNNFNQRQRSSIQQTPRGTQISEPLSSRYFLPSNKCFTGKIIINLKDCCVRFETIDEENEKKTEEQPLKAEEQCLQQLLERIASYGNERNVQLLQLIDLNLLSSKGAYEEKKIFETLKERYDECMQYKRSMIIYDLDSLIGVNKSESESSMGTSVSSSIVNQGVYIYVSSRFREAFIGTEQSNNQLTVERWAVAVVRDPFLLNKFTADVDFQPTDSQVKEDEKAEQRSKDLLYCIKCQDRFIETENKMGSCTYHDGFLYDNLSVVYERSTPSAATKILHREERRAVTHPEEKDRLDREKTRFKYICCDATFQVGMGTNGCKKDQHGGDKDDDGWERNKIDARDYRKVKDGLEQWEKACLDDEGYIQKLTNMIEGL